MNAHPPRLQADVSYLDKVYQVTLTPDVVYGVGGVGYVAGQGPAHYRELKLDVYQPVSDSKAPRPALILAFGGAFHRGAKGAEVFEGENPSTAMADYCREFARRGYVCFSIDYRLMQEEPDPGVTPFLLPGQPQNTDRIDFVRNILGLPPCTPQMMADTLEAATDDMTKAINFVRNRSQAYGIDVTRIACGGFSAGAAIALNSAYAERAPVAAVIALSGRIAGPTMDSYLAGGEIAPAALLFHGERDLPVILGGVEEMRAHFGRVGVDNQFVQVAGADHFYQRTAKVVRADGSACDVETVIAEFLHDKLRLADAVRMPEHTVTIATLEAFADAWNRHDIDALMSFMSDDCAFEANAGPDVSGTVFRGRDEVRRGFMRAWQLFPDARWSDARHFISGDRGCSEWIFSGTGADGKRVEVAGCDIFWFKGGKIAVKNSFRKQRS